MSGRDGGRSDDHMRAIVQRFATNVLAHHRRDQFSSDLEAWRDLATESEELLEASTVIATELHRQTEAVTSLEDHMDSAGDDTVTGAEQLLDAEKSQAKRLPWAAGGTGATVGAVVGIIGGPLGVAAGAFVGGSIGGFIGRIPKKLIDRECEANRAILRGDRVPITGIVAADATSSVLHFPSPGPSPGGGSRGRRQQAGAKNAPHAPHASPDAAEVQRLKVSCLESILAAMSVSTESNWILDADRKAIGRTAQEEQRQRTAQVIADRHLKGLERGWLQAFVRPFTMKGTPPTPTRLAAASWMPGRGQAAAAAQQDAWVSLDGAGNEDGVWDGDGDAVVDQIQVALGELKASQTALGDEVVDQLGKLALLDDGVSRNLEHARRLDRRTTRLND